MTPTDQLFDKLPRLPSIPRVVQALILTLDNPDADLAHLIAEVKHDQALSLRVLRLANSSYYGLSRKVGAIDDAVTLVGLNALRTLVVTSGITWAFPQVPGVNLQAFWRHAMLTAMVARSLARHAGINGEFAYTAGLIHRVGQLLIALAMPDLARIIGAECHDSSVAELAAIEHAHLGLDHCEVGAEQARQWNFPAVIRNAVRWYADPLGEEACPYAGVVYLAAQIAFGIEAGHDDTRIITDMHQELCRRLVLDVLDWASVIERVREQSAEAASIATLH